MWRLWLLTRSSLPGLDEVTRKTHLLRVCCCFALRLCKHTKETNFGVRVISHGTHPSDPADLNSSRWQLMLKRGTVLRMTGPNVKHATDMEVPREAVFCYLFMPRKALLPSLSVFHPFCLAELVLSCSIPL